MVVRGVKFSGSRCVELRSRGVHSEVSHFNSGLCLRFNNGLFSSFRTTHILPNFGPSTGIGVLLRLGGSTRVIVIVGTSTVRGGGHHNSLNVACSLRALQLVSTFHRVKLCINDIIVAYCSNRRSTSTFRGHLRTLNVGICHRCSVPSCPTGVPLVMDRGNFNGGSCVRARGGLIVIATPNPNDNGVTAYLSRLCRRGGHKVGTKCTGFRAFPV